MKEESKVEVTVPKRPPIKIFTADPSYPEPGSEESSAKNNKFSKNELRRRCRQLRKLEVIDTLSDTNTF